MPGTRVSVSALRGTVMFALLAGMMTVSVWGNPTMSWYGMLLLPILLAKLVLSFCNRTPEGLVGGFGTAGGPVPRVGVIVTVYNEDADYLRDCLDSLRQQDLRPERVVVVDDASADAGARRLAATYPEVTLVVHPVNKGKREAMATGVLLLEGEVDVYACIDSDARLEPDALAQGVRPFADPRVMATTGLIVPSNYARNVLTRLIDVRYVNAFLVERGAYSALRSVLCVCGVLAFYRAEMMHRHLDAFLAQTFMGSPAIIGDDRHLTNRALLDGDVVMVAGAVAHTAVPENISHYVRQQTRWGRSFFRESLWSLCHHTPARPAWWLSLIEMFQWLVFTSLLVYVLAVHPFLVGGIPIVEYLAFVALSATIRSVRYFDLEREEQSRASRLYTFALTPLFGMLNLFVMIPLRLWSVVTLRRAAWGTREVIEVTVGESQSTTAHTSERSRGHVGQPAPVPTALTATTVEAA